MRKIIACEFMTLDGVIQNDNNDGDGFKYSGWFFPFADEVTGAVVQERLAKPVDLLLGRKTFDGWETYWPTHSNFWPNVMTATKYVASNTRDSSDWQPTVFLSGDLAEKVRQLKQTEGPDIHVMGSADMLQTLFKNDLVDALELMIIPVTLGTGKRLFQDGTIPASFKVTRSQIAPNGIIIANYERDGDVRTGQPQIAENEQQTGYAPVNGLKMYYEVHGSGEPVVLLHGSYMTITNNWTGWIGELSKTRKVIAVEMQGHGRTADINRDFSYENLADDVASLLDYLKIQEADIVGYSLGGGVAMQCAIRHPEKVRKVVSISARFRHDGIVKEGLDAFPQLTAEKFKGSPIETEYKKLSPAPDEFPNFVKHLLAMALKPFDFGAEKLKATKAPMFFIHGDADGVRLDHISEMFRLKGGEIHGDLRPRSASRLAILPGTTHVTLMARRSTIVPMVNDFLDAQIEEND